MRSKDWLCSAWCLVSGLCACGFDEVSDGSASACASGRSTTCAGPNGCEGYQICRADGSGYDGCICSSAPAGLGGAMASNGFGGTPDSRLGSGGSRPSAGGGMGVVVTAGFGSSGGSGSSGSSTPAGGCKPADMSGFAYPPYKPARQLLGSCTDSDIRDYYDECYVKGNCTDFGPSGAKASCGSCLAPTRVNDSSYGPMLRLGDDQSPLDETNMAGCIELMGEVDCAKKMMVATLCEYYSCTESCPAQDTASYQTLMSCMMQARGSTCSAAQSAAVCIKDSSHVAACSGAGFQAQFLALGQVFCVRSP